MTDHAEAQVAELLRAASSGPWEADTVLAVVRVSSTGYEIEEPADLKLAALAPSLAATALDLARALRKLGDTCGLDDAEFRKRLDAEGTIFPAVPFAELRDALDALDRWDRLTKELSDG